MKEEPKILQSHYMIGDEKRLIGKLGELTSTIFATTAEIKKAFKPFNRFIHSPRRWRMMAPTGRNKKQRKFDQTRLKGRGKKERRNP